MSTVAIASLCLPLTVAHGQWYPSNNPNGVSVEALVRYGPTILVATSNGVFASSNRGARWTSTSGGLPITSILSFAVADTTVLAGTFDQTVYRSSDGGVNWEWSGNGIYSVIHHENNMVRCLATSGTEILAGTGGGVFSSVDGGVNWQPSSNGLTDRNILALESDGVYVYAGTAGGGVFRSTDGGSNWSAANDSLTDTYIPALKQVGSVLFAGTGSTGIFTSTDFGSTWKRHNSGLSSLPTILSFGYSGTSIFAGTALGIFTSSDGGDSWEKAEGVFAGYTTANFYSEGDTVFAATGSGVIVSSDQGRHWTPVNAGLTRTRVYALHVSDTSVVAGIEWPGVIVLNSDGAACVAMDTTRKTFGARAIAGEMDGLFAGNWGSGVVYSTNGGYAWTPASNGLSSPYVYALLADGGTLLAGTLKGVFRTTDSGGLWSNATSGMGSVHVLCFATHGTDLFAGTASGVFRSTDLGASWTAAGAGLPVTDINALASLGDKLFAGTNSFAVFRLMDGDTNWMPAYTGMPEASFVTSFAVSGNAVFAGTFTGVFMTKDDGATWSSINQGLSDTAVVSLAVQGSFLFAGTSANGIFLRRISEVIDSAPDVARTEPAGFRLLQNYPNPFNPTTAIEYVLAKSSMVKLSVYDILGREVAVIINENENAGTHEVRFDALALSSGVYFYRLQAGDFVQTHKMLLVR
jgi:photosystem II stability/assembly factor-like uncharacterized protein